MPQSKAFQAVHYISIWSIWPMHNFSQFEGRLTPPFQVPSHVIVTAKFYYSQGNPSKPQIIGKLTMDKTFTWMEHAKGMIICCIGGILFLQKQHSFHLISNAGQGTKNWVELLAPQALFRLAHNLKITDLQVFRDSLVIKWMTNDQNINGISHLTLEEHVKAISLQFTKISYLHICREIDQNCRKTLWWGAG